MENDMTNFVCTWCRKEVKEQDFELHTTAHYVELQDKWTNNPFTTITTTGAVSYVKKQLNVWCCNDTR